MENEKIIIVDDELDVLELCERILKGKGYQVQTAHNGFEAIELTRREHFDLLLTDIKMPGMNGLEIAQALKKYDPEIICVAMTGFSTMDMVIEALRLGIDEFITKPFAPDELSLIVAKAFEKDRLRKEVFRLRSLIPLFELNKTLMGTVQVEQVLQTLLEIARKETQANLACLYTIDEEEEISPTHFPARDKAKPEIYDQLARRVIEAGEQFELDRRQSSLEKDRRLLERLAMQAIIATPLRSQNRNLGALIVARADRDFGLSAANFLAMLCSQASIALENARLFTEIQQAYESLKQLDYMKSEFINIAAHELRTPLAILMGYAAVLEDETDGVQKEYTANMMRNAMRLRSLIDDMLNLQYLESGLTSLSHETVDLRRMFEQVIQDMSLITTEKNLDIDLQIPEEAPPLITDHQKLDLVIINLMYNAIEFTPREGEITVKARTEGDQMIFSVANTGSVIPKEELNRIFDRFYQVEKTLTRGHRGMGLGLAIVRGMVDVCGGQIEVESEEETGTIFTVILPLDNTPLGDEGLVEI